jgi:hypothetical protein
MRSNNNQGKLLGIFKRFFEPESSANTNQNIVIITNTVREIFLR